MAALQRLEYQKDPTKAVDDGWRRALRLEYWTHEALVHLLINRLDSLPE